MRILKLSKFLFFNEIREFNGFFWPIIFPGILFFILVSIFSGVSTESYSTTFNLAIVEEEQLAGFGKILERVLDQIRPDPFQMAYFQSFEEAEKALKSKKVDLILRIPEGFNVKLMRAVLFSDAPAKIDLYTLSNYYESSTAAQILSMIFQQVDLSISRQMKNQSAEYVSVEAKTVAVEKETENEFHYATYIFPGILLMSVLSIAVFNLPLTLIYNRYEGINKKLHTTPVGVLDYFTSLSLSLVSMMIISCVVVYSMGIFIYGVSHNCLSGEFLVKLFYAMIVCSGLGIMIASFCKKISTAMVISQISYQILMFLGSFYFPVLNYNMPEFLKVIARMLPTTYLVEDLRVSLGYNFYSFSAFDLWVLPGIWFAISMLIFMVNFKKVMGYE